MKDWVKVSPTERIVRVGRGQRLEVDCEAIGSPSPRLQWYKEARPVTQVRVTIQYNSTREGTSSCRSLNIELLLFPDA